MKTLSKLILVLTVITVCAKNPHTNPPPTSSGWIAFDLNGRSSGSTAPLAGEVATITIPQCPKGAGPLAFLTTTSSPGLLGNLTGKTVSSTIQITGSPVFTYWGEGQSFNNCPRIANVRLYVSSVTGYSPNGPETQYWWSNPFSFDLAAIANAGPVTLSVLLNPANWSDGQGHWGNNPAYTPGFNAAIANVHQIGFSFAGGCFFDVGAGVLQGTGTATFHVLSYTAQ